MQTVPRSEVSACHALVTHLDFNTHAEFYSDNQLFVEAFNKGLIYCNTILNADLYNEIYELIVDKNIKIEVYWIPSHMFDEPLKERKNPPPDWFTDMHALGNHHADRLAGISASHYALHNHIATPIIHNVFLVRNIQRRLYSIIRNLPNIKINREAKIPKPPRPSLLELIATSEHTINDLDNEVIRCEVCRGSSTKSGHKARDFVLGPCKANPINPHKIVKGQVYINGSVTHPSHNLRCTDNQ